MKLTLTLLALLSAGCTNAVKPLSGHIGPYSLHRATAQPFLGPNITQIWSYDGTNAPQCVYSAAGEGVGPVLIKALGEVAKGAAIGVPISQIRPSKTDINAGNTSADTIFIQH